MKCKWVESLLWGVRECSACARGGRESARAKRDGWERVVEDGEVVVGWSCGDRGECKPDEKAKTRQRRRVKKRNRPG